MRRRPGELLDVEQLDVDVDAVRLVRYGQRDERRDRRVLDSSDRKNRSLRAVPKLVKTSWTATSRWCASRMSCLPIAPVIRL